jgi:DNA repair exonuclease SbcCD ATPase subunit
MIKFSDLGVGAGEGGREMTATEAFEIAGGVALAKLDEKNERIKQLEAELAEAKAKLEEQEQELDGLRWSYSPAMAEAKIGQLTTELTEFKRQIAEGTLVPVGKCVDLVAEYEGYWKALPYGVEERVLTFDQFAAEMARKDAQ